LLADEIKREFEDDKTADMISVGVVVLRGEVWECARRLRTLIVEEEGNDRIRTGKGK
jgi:hypothetical protein